MNQETSSYIVIHGHFYQPPRENPWTELVERQKETFPYHNWNELITYQCYIPNAWARVLNEKNKIVDIINNYSYINFNFGPTLFSWLEKNFPSVIERVLQADRESLEKNDRCGNAIAQVYNHMIMPLAEEKDRFTQVRWGIRFFEKKFGRLPEAMWLPETAIDYPTARVLIECGMKFVILSPLQAKRIKPIDADESSWVDVSDGNIDTGMPYRLFLKNEKGSKIKEKFIDVFFFHHSLSHAISFEKLLKDSISCANKIEEVIKERKYSPYLVSIATDGETFGHHHPFSEMCIAYLVKYELARRGIKPVNYSWYLKNNPPTYEVEIKEGTSWSCVHGLGRWKEDCGCNTGAHPDWNQKWRKPLRDTLNWLKGELDSIFEREGADVFKDSWQARDDYIEVIVDPSPGNVERFLSSHLKSKDDPFKKTKALKLLEMQKFGMLMFTSCGWFFDEISEIQTVQNLRYAGSAIQYVKDLTGRELEEDFLIRLSEAKSNIEEFKDGKGVYEKLVRPSVVDWQKAFARHLILETFLEEKEYVFFPTYSIKTAQTEEKEIPGVFLKTGRGGTFHLPTREEKEGVFFLVNFGKHKIYCFVADNLNDDEYLSFKEKVFSEEVDLNFQGIINVVSPFFKKYFTLKDLPGEDREKILSYLMEERIDEIRKISSTLFDRHIQLIREFVRLGWQIPSEFSFFLTDVLNSRIVEEFEKFEVDEDFEYLERAKSIKEIADDVGLKLDTLPLAKIAEKKIIQLVRMLEKGLDPGRVEIIVKFKKYLTSLGVFFRTYETQNKIWEIFNKMILQKMNIFSNKKEKSLLEMFILLAQELNFDGEILKERIKKVTG